MEAGENNIFQKLLAVQMELKVPKNHYNEFADFEYRNAEDILDAAKPICREHGLLLLLSDEVIERAGKSYIEATARAIEIETGIELKVKAQAREPEKPKAKMDESQATGATSSYARKYALNGLFCLDDNKDPDTNQKGDDPGKQEKKQVQKPASNLAGGSATAQETEKIKQIAAKKYPNNEYVFTQNEVTAYKNLRTTKTAKEVIKLMETELNSRLNAYVEPESTFKDDDIPFDK